MELEIHELSKMFPAMTPDAYAALVGSMRAFGYNPNFPIILFEDAILDGRHRYTAAREAGVSDDITTTPFIGDYAAARTYAIQANAIRRDLTPAQKAATAAAMVNTDRAGGRPRKDDRGNGFTVARAAGEWGISKRVVSHMRTVLLGDRENGTDIHERTMKGELSVSQAYAEHQGIVQPPKVETHPLNDLIAAVAAAVETGAAYIANPNRALGDKTSACLQLARAEFDRVKEERPELALQAALIIREPVGELNAALSAQFADAERVIANTPDEALKLAGVIS